MIRLHARPLSPSPVSKLDLRHTGRLRKRQFAGGREGWGRAWSPILRPQERLVLYISFNTLCSTGCKTSTRIYKRGNRHELLDEYRQTRDLRRGPREKMVVKPGTKDASLQTMRHEGSKTRIVRRGTRKEGRRRKMRRD
jgi:hypothetical protein